MIKSMLENTMSVITGTIVDTDLKIQTVKHKNGI